MITRAKARRGRDTRGGREKEEVYSKYKRRGGIQEEREKEGGIKEGGRERHTGKRKRKGLERGDEGKRYVHSVILIFI